VTHALIFQIQEATLIDHIVNILKIIIIDTDLEKISMTTAEGTEEEQHVITAGHTHTTAGQPVLADLLNTVDKVE
jgi:hypothetical protein